MTSFYRRFLRIFYGENKTLISRMSLYFPIKGLYLAFWHGMIWQKIAANNTVTVYQCNYMFLISRLNFCTLLYFHIYYSIAF